MGHTPFKLVYGLEAVVPTEYTMPSLRIAISERLGDVESNFSRLVTLEKLSESRQLALHALGAEKLHRKAWHDRNLRDKKLVDGDLVLLYSSKKHKGKLKLTGNGPYRIDHIYPMGVVMLKDLEGTYFPDLINGSRLKKYYYPMSEPPKSVIPPR